jgi:hypothetical protein
MYIALSLLLILALAWYLHNYIRRRQLWEAKPPPPKTVIEFWVYAEEPKTPTQEAIIQMIRQSPGLAKHFGAEEGLVFSDIRFSLGTVLRDKNPYLFLGDTVLERDAVLPKDFAERAGRAMAVHTVRFVAEEPKYDEREAAALRLSALCAAAIAALNRGTLVVDIESQTAWTPEEFTSLVETDPTAVDWHTAIREGEQEGEILFLTRGMAKRGMYDLVAAKVPADETTVTRALLAKVVEDAWRDPANCRPQIHDAKMEKLYDMNFAFMCFVGDSSRVLHRSPWIACLFVRMGTDEEWGSQDDS